MTERTGIYLCGPIHGKTDDECKSWRSRVKHLFDQHFHTLEYIVIDPMDRDYRGVEEGNEDEIVRSDLEDIDVCEFVIVNAATASWGTAMEVFYAFLSKKVVLAFPSSAVTSPWLRRHTTHLCLTVEDACVKVMQLNSQRLAKT